MFNSDFANRRIKISGIHSLVLPVGKDTLYAKYAGQGNFAGSISASISVTISAT